MLSDWGFQYTDNRNKGCRSSLHSRPLSSFDLAVSTFMPFRHMFLCRPPLLVLNPDLLSPWVTPSATDVVYNDPINPQLYIQLTPLQPPDLGGGIGFRIAVGPGRYIDLRHVTGTATSPSRLYRVRAQAVTFNDCTPTVSPKYSPRYHTSCRK